MIRFARASMLAFFLVGLVPAFSQSLTEADREKILTTAKGFLEALSARDQTKVNGALASGIEVRYISKMDLKKKIDAMIQNELSALDYLKVVSGYNAHKFLKEFDGRTWELATRPELPREVLDETIDHGGGQTRYYFLKFQMQVQEVNASTSQTKTFSRLVEIDFVPLQGEFKIFGFII
ncbi:MAG: hypothetical protein J0L75_13265 [Spirochaetes bacterium]|nr:hypothetical protein [Spirochaetota bacterium]